MASRKSRRPRSLEIGKGPRPGADRRAVARESFVGSAVALGLVIGLGAAMFPLRSHLSVATTALVLVVPVVAGVAKGGFAAGIVATASGFLVYDFVFIPPYYTLSVGAAENWAALGVYAVVMVVVARVVARLNDARAEAQLRARDSRRLFDLSELLVRESSLPELLETIVGAALEAFRLDGAALLLPDGDRLSLAASAGEPLTSEELQRLSFTGGLPVSLESANVGRGGIQAVALSASGDAIGLLALRGLSNASSDHELLRAFSNHLALALERAQLREQAVRAELLEEVDRLRRSLVGAVSHDLRTPLATIKLSASTLLDADAPVGRADAHELLGLIDAQADRLDRLVSNILDMTRIQSGALELRRRPTAVSDLVDEALSVFTPSADFDRIRWIDPGGLPLVDVDAVLICQVLVNLVDNAVRYAPSGTPVTIVATAPASATTYSGARAAGSGGGGGSVVVLSVADLGAGVPSNERATVFQMFNRREAGGRGGLGLAIAQAFVEAHGQHIWVEDADERGARFVFTLPVVGRGDAG